MATVVTAGPEHLGVLAVLDTHVTGETMLGKIAAGQVLVVLEGDVVVAGLRFGLFWDEIPFMNMLWVLEERRGRGIGSELVRAWEARMRDQGHSEVLTSTMANETAQEFYRKLGYVDTGALLVPGDPLELFLRKEL